MPDYSIYLRNDKIKLYNRFGWFLIIIQLLFAGWVTSSMNKRVLWPLIVLLLLSGLVFFLQQTYKKSFSRFGLHPYFALGIFFWVMIGFYPVAGLLFLFDLLHTIATKKPLVEIMKEGISYPSLVKKSASWNELNNIILKDGLLTIDFKDDRLLQQPLDPAQPGIDERAFNEYCGKQLTTHR